MSQKLEVQLVPVGADEPHMLDYDLDGSAACAALFYRDSVDWEKSSLEIKWNSADRYFSVEFKGSGEIDVPLAELLSKRVPLQIARASTCDCGTTLELGDYAVAVEDNDFRFQANYFCPSCKSRLTAEKNGLKRVLETWFTGLKKIEIKTTGVGLERA